MMAYLFKKKVRGLTYWYLGENKKINGVSRRTWQKYIGTANAIKKKLAKISTPLEVDVLEFGVCSAMLSVNEELCFVKIVDDVIDKREQGLSYGEHLLLTVINRIDNPASKNKLGDWFDSTVLKRFFPVKKSYLSSQVFWNHWNNISEEQIEQIQELLLEKLVKKCDVSDLCFDPTNFATYIRDHKNQKIMQFGHAKDGRKGFRQVNLSMLVTKKDGIPLWHHTYNGNINDVTEFKEFIRAMTKRVAFFTSKCRKITLVFDKGNNSHNNIKSVSKKLSFFMVGSLKPSQFPELFNIPLEEFTEEHLAGSHNKVFCTSKLMDLYDGKKKVVITYSNELAYKNRIRVEKALNKAFNKLQNLKNRLKNLSRDEVLIKVHEIVDKKYIKGLISYSIEQRLKRVGLTFKRKEKAYTKLSKRFGKNLLFTDDLSLKTTDVVKIYNSKSVIEEQIKQLKDKHVISFTPMWCWTDKMIMVHAFTCVTALLFLRLIVKKIHDEDIELSQTALLEQLKKIKLTLLKMPNSDKIHAKLTRLNNTQKELAKLFRLENYH